MSDIRSGYVVDVKWIGVIGFFDYDTSLQVGYREDAMAIFAFVKPSCVFIRTLDINFFQPGFLRIVNSLFHIFSPIFNLPEKRLPRMADNQRSPSGP
jgi:hypothetical protein